MEYSQQSEVICSFVACSSNGREEDLPGASLNGMKPGHLMLYS